MGQIVLKIPKRRKKMQIIQSERRLNEIIEERHNYIRDVFKVDDFKLPVDTIETDIDSIKILMPYIDAVNAEDFENKISDAEKKEYIVEAETEATNIISGYTDPTISQLIVNDPIIDIEIPESEPESLKTIFTEIFQVTDKDKPIKVIRNDDRKKTIEVDIAEKYVQEAYDRGYEDCKEIAELNAREQVSEAYRYVRRIDNLIKELSEHYKSEIVRFDEKLIDIAITVAEIIIDKEVQTDSQNIINQINKIMLEFNADAVFDITINPNDLLALEQAKSALTIDSKSFASATITTDKNIKQGGCILTTSAGNIDATIDTRIRKIRQTLQTISDEDKANSMPFQDNPIPEAEYISDAIMEYMNAPQ